MRSEVVLALLGLSTMGSAVPFDMDRRSGISSSFRIPRVSNGKSTLRSGPVELAKAYHKYGIPVSQDLMDTVEKILTEWESGKARRDTLQSFKRASNSSQTGKVTATPEAQDVAYLCPVKIGGQTLNLDFDTGSADLWVYSSELSSSVSAGHSVYDPSKSSTWSKMSGSSFSIQYGDGSSASGDVGTDVVNVGGATVQKQAVELATKLSGSFTDDKDSDGLLGLAFSSINTVSPSPQKTFFDNIMDDLAEPVFVADLRKGTAGAYEFGQVTSAHTGDLTWVPIDKSQGWWQFSSSTFKVGSGSSQQSSGGDAIADTGTTLIIADDETVQGYYKQVSGAKLDNSQGGYVFDCSSKLPDLSLDIGGKYMAVVSGDDINFAPVSQGSSSCFGGVQPGGNSGGVPSIFGDIMFKSQLVVFSGGNDTIGMAPHS